MGRAGHTGPLKPPPRFEWRALKGQPRHAFRPTGIGRAVGCGAERVDPRFMWPSPEKCEPCVAEVDRLTRQALGLPVAELGL